MSYIVVVIDSRQIPSEEAFGPFRTEAIATGWQKANHPVAGVVLPLNRPQDFTGFRAKR
jgi:hypothetical protein